MNVDLLIKENKELYDEKQRYKEMWFTTNNSLAKYRKLEEELGCPFDVVDKALKNGIYNGVPEYISAVGLVYINNFYGFMLTCFNKNGKQTGCYPTSEYKKTWWLKENHEE